MSACKSCGAKITWCRTEAGKLMPVDAESVDDGNLLVRLVTGSGWECRVIGKVQPQEGELRYTSHYATCPNADQHRRNR